jgi:hypothetical protein
MTDRVKGFTVALSKDIRIDDIKEIETALKMIQGVVGVKPVITEAGAAITEMRLRHLVREKLEQIYNELL